MIQRKIAVKMNEKQFDVTHIQEALWPDNQSPDKNKEINSYQRISYLLEMIKKHRK